MVKNTNTVKIVKNTAIDIPADALGNLHAALGTMAENASAFRRRTILAGVTAVGEYITATANLNISKSELFKNVNVGELGMSRATLYRWATVAELHKHFGIDATEGSASAAYGLTESGMTAIKAAVGSLPTDSITNGDELVAAIADATESHKAIESSAPTSSLTAEDDSDSGTTVEDVTGAAVSIGAFREQVDALFARLDSADLTEARKYLKALAATPAKVKA